MHFDIFLSRIWNKFKAVLLFLSIDQKAPAFIRPLHIQPAFPSIGEFHVHKAFHIRRPDIILCSGRKLFFFPVPVRVKDRHRKLPRGYQSRLFLLRVANIDFCIHLILCHRHPTLTHMEFPVSVICTQSIYPAGKVKLIRII